MPTEPRSVFIRTKEGEKTYAVNLDSALANHQWETRYLQQGFREPDTGVVIGPRAIEAVSVRPIDGSAAPLGSESRLTPFPGEGALAWLEGQVEETCTFGR